MTASTAVDEGNPYSSGNCAGSGQAGDMITRVTIRRNVFEDNQYGNAALDLCHVQNSLISENRFLNSGDHIEITGSNYIMVKRNIGTGAQDALRLVNSHHISIVPKFGALWH